MAVMPFKVLRAALVVACCILADTQHNFDDGGHALDEFITIQKPIAVANLLCNIGHRGHCVPGTDPGLVVASPSPDDPDYIFTWTRDAALVLKYLTEDFHRDYSLSLQQEIQDFINSQAILQSVSSRSGGLDDGQGLGEPKFHINSTEFKLDWSRPQRDGPALRAITLTAYAKWLLEHGYQDTVEFVIWPILHNDLLYVAEYWNEVGYDLWEEDHSWSYFTVANSYRALIEGASLARVLSRDCPDCEGQAVEVLCMLQTFWNDSKGFMKANLRTEWQRYGTDANTILASIHLFDPEATCDSLTLQPCSDRALANHKAVVDVFRSEYSINQGIASGRAVAIGRYQEDTYQGGHPWYLTTCAAAEQLYAAIQVWRAQGEIVVTATSLPFFRDLDAGINVGTHAAAAAAGEEQPGQTYQRLLASTRTYADGFLAIAARYTQANGSMSEQFHRDDGHPLSAYDLTWSYAAFLSAVARRNGHAPPSSWVGKGVLAVKPPSPLPSTCSPRPYVRNGTHAYRSAATTRWPSTGQPPVSRTEVSTRATGHAKQEKSTAGAESSHRLGKKEL